MYVSRVWRNWNNGFTNDGRGKFEAVRYRYRRARSTRIPTPTIRATRRSGIRRSSNRVTVFSILDSGEGTVRSYAHDTQCPRSPAFEVDCFPLDVNAAPNPCDG